MPLGEADLKEPPELFYVIPALAGRYALRPGRPAPRPPCAPAALRPGRPAAVLAADVHSSADGFSAAADGMPARAWQRTVRWTTGHETEAALVVPMRLGEVLIHHVDLDIGYRPRDWPAAFVGDYLDRAVSALRGQAEWPGQSAWKPPTPAGSMKPAI